MRKIRIAAVLFIALCGIALVSWLPGQYVVPVLMYHRVVVALTERDSANSVSPAAFERQMAYIKRHGYRVLTMDEYAAMTRAGKGFPPRSVVITFDDGVLDNYTQAYPVLLKYGLPAVMFVPSADVGLKDAGWSTPQMGWDQLREMSAHGVTIGSHTLTHAYLPDVNLERSGREIAESKKTLEQQLGRRIDYLAYPTGGFSDDIKRQAREAGYAAAFTTNRGRDRMNRDLYELKRIRIKDTDGAIELWVKLSGYYNRVRDSRNSQ